MAANFDQRTVARLAGLFSGLALLLAAVGLYGVTAYSLTRRTGEIGAQLFEIGKWDPESLLLAIALIAACTLAAAILPARRAAWLNPTDALRTE